MIFNTVRKKEEEEENEQIKKKKVIYVPKDSLRFQAPLKATLSAFDYWWSEAAKSD